MGAIEKLISESGVVTGLSAVGGMIGGLADAARAELTALREELAAYKLTLLDTESQYEAGLDIIKGLRAENARLREALDPENIAAIIRRADGNHSLGAGELGEAIAAAISGAPAGIWLSLEQARQIEWRHGAIVGHGNGEQTRHSTGFCVACGMRNPKFGGAGHSHDCWLAAKIKQAEEE